MNKKILVPIIIALVAFIVIIRVSFFLFPHGDAPAPGPTPAKEPPAWQSEGSFGKGSLLFTPGPAENSPIKSDQQKELPSLARSFYGSTAERGGPEPEAPAPAETTETGPMKMGEEIRASLNRRSNTIKKAANALPTDAEIQAGIDARNEQAMKSSALIAEHQARANAISAQIRNMGPSELSPETTNTQSTVAASQTPPAALVQEVQERKYIAH